MSGRWQSHEREFQWGGIPGSAFDDLAAVAIDKYLADPADPFARRTGKAICGQCVVVDVCRQNALNSINLPRQGVIAGESASRIWAGRSWRNYETGVTETAPRVTRPPWLTEFSEAADMTMHTRMLEDAD